MLLSVKALGPLETNCYIVNGALLIDPGDDVPGLDAFIRENGAHIEYALITHGHYDHMRGAAHMQQAYGARLLISRADEQALFSPEAALVPAETETRFTPCHADGYLEEGPLALAGVKFTVIPTPGHTPGGICLYSEAEKTHFSGDTLFRYGFGRTDMPGGDMHLLVESLRTLLRLPDDTRVWPGHGEGGLMGDIRRSYYR